MSIVSFSFAGFTALLLFLYYVLPKKCQWAILLLASTVFYLAGGWKGCFYILVTIITQYLLARALERKNGEMAEELANQALDGKQKKEIKKKYSRKKRRYLLLSLFINLGILCTLKYTNPVIETLNQLFGTSIDTLSILLPLGLSYYTFKSVGYVIDVYRGRIKAQRNIFKLALYISYFPALLQGPLDRYEDLAGQLYAEHKFDYKGICYGAQRMLWGYIKKLVIADRALVVVNTIMETYQQPNRAGFILFFGLALYGFQIYADFSGGMDIVNGLSEMFGIRLTENFQRPYFSTSVAEFWQRWHITLGAWMRTYVFYPLSLSPAFNNLGKKCRKRFGDKYGKLMAPSLASFFTFVLIGLWHGVGWKYLLYGLYMAFFVSAGTLFEDFYAQCRAFFRIKDESKAWHVFQSLRTFFIISMSRYVDMADNIPEMFRMFKATFTNFNPWVFFDGTFYELGLDRPNLTLLFLSILLLMGVDYAQEKGIRIRETIGGQSVVLRWGIYYAAVFFLLIFGRYGLGYDATSFIYARF